MIRIYNTLTHEKAVFEPKVAGRVSIYVCGVTPYDEAHIGHARPAVIWDVIKRHLERRGYVVKHVQNFTDVDDKVILRAEEQGESVFSLGQRYMRQYLSQMKALGVKPPEAYPQVTENITEIVEYIEDLVEKGFAYSTGSGDVYFDVSQKSDYGKLSRRSLAGEEGGHRDTQGAGKKRVEDFALWKAASLAEPSWESPWGRGRPGWHIECSAMAERYLGSEIDLHGGGIDLVFPHHENEIAQTEAHQGRPTTTIFMHNGHVTVSNVKMSKSEGNGISLASLLARWQPAVLRTYLLSAHYRSPLAFDEDRLGDIQRGLDKVWTLFDWVQGFTPPGNWTNDPAIETLVAFEDHFLAALDDDFDTPKAMAMVFDMVRSARPVIDQGGPNGEAAGYLVAKNLRRADRLLGFLPNPGESRQNDSEVQTILDALVRTRDQARTHQAYELADGIRQLLLDLGWRLEDTPAGTRLVAQMNHRA